MKKALIVHGGWEGHDPDGVSSLFARVLKTENYDVTLSDTLDVLLSDLSVYDLIIPIWTMSTLPEAAEANICKAVANGCGLAGCHGGMCDAFRNSTNWQFMTGAQWVAHPGGDTVTYEVNINKASSSPLVEGIKDFKVTSEQYYIHFDPAVDVLATTTFTYPGEHLANGYASIPVAFTKRWGEGKIYYNTLGHTSKVFEIPEALEMMRRGFLWATR